MSLQPLTSMSTDEAEFDSAGDDAKKSIMDQFEGTLDSVRLHKALVLVATFQRDKVGKNSKILSAEVTKKEDVYQGRVGLVVKTGPLAFKNSADVDFAGMQVKPGDWALYTPQNGTRVMIHGVECRLLEDVHIDGDIVDPYDIL